VVIDGGKRRTNRTFFGWWTEYAGNLQLQVYRSDDGQIVAIVDAASPELALIVYDFGSGYAWPAYEGSDEAEVDRRGRILLQRLKESGGPQFLELSIDGVGARVGL
jgi:hypothetical protein